MNTIAENTNDTNDESLAPGDLFIDTTTTTLFQVMDYHRFGCTPSQIVEALDITYDQVLFALEYIEKNRVEVETAYQADRRNAAQRFIHTLIGSYRPEWQDSFISLGGIGVGLLLVAIAISIGYQFIVLGSSNQGASDHLVDALLSIICGVGGITIVVLGIRLMLDMLSLRYDITVTWITTTRYGGIPAYSIPVAAIVEAYLEGQFFHFTCDNGKIYRVLALKQIRQQVLDVPAKGTKL